jgi:hypothetical protein
LVNHQVALAGVLEARNEMGVDAPGCQMITQ